MSNTPVPAPRTLDERYLARPLVLVAVLVMAGHQIRGDMDPDPAGYRINNEEVVRHE